MDCGLIGSNVTNITNTFYGTNAGGMRAKKWTPHKV